LFKENICLFRYLYFGVHPIRFPQKFRFDRLHFVAVMVLKLILTALRLTVIGHTCNSHVTGILMRVAGGSGRTGLASHQTGSPVTCMTPDVLGSYALWNVPFCSSIGGVCGQQCAYAAVARTSDSPFMTANALDNFDLYEHCLTLYAVAF
jgi:hypothetical protein